MGTNTNQIATRANINSGKRKNAYYISSSTDAQKCPTKGEINQIEFLDVKNASTARTEDNAYDSYYGMEEHMLLFVQYNGLDIIIMNIIQEYAIRIECNSNRYYCS